MLPDVLTVCCHHGPTFSTGGYKSGAQMSSSTSGGIPGGIQGRPPTLSRFVRSRQSEYPEATGDFTALLNALALGGKLISRQINLAGLVEVTGYTSRTNIQGEEVAKLDDWSNDLFIDLLSETGLVCALGSEELDEPIFPQSGRDSGKYIVSYDPVDGSSNIDIAAPIGTIFSIYPRMSASGDCSVADLLQPGRNQVAAGYILYGSSTIFCYTTGHGVHAFTLDQTMGEYHLTNPDLKFPTQSNVYSTNEGNSGSWLLPDRQWVDYIKENDPETGRPYSARYIGALVADFHRILLKGGIFAYPGNTTNEEGKLRMLYECAPMAFLAEQAGGAATNGTLPILDVTPTRIHQRSPFYVGNKSEVDLVGSFHGMAAQSP
jgi:fructose-1,6-bisphosphatase I